MGTKPLSQPTKPNGRKKIDSKSRIPRTILREQVTKIIPQHGRVGETCIELGDPVEFGEFLEEELDKDTAGTGCVFFGETDGG